MTCRRIHGDISCFHKRNIQTFEFQRAEQHWRWHILPELEESRELSIEGFRQSVGRTERSKISGGADNLMEIGSVSTS